MWITQKLIYLECHHFLLLQLLTSKNLKRNQTKKRQMFFKNMDILILFYSFLFSLVLCDNLDGWGGREAHEGGDICIHIAGSLCCTAENNRAL